ncbi:hypothetical protein ACWGQ5_45140 [Streptomyces sp. NPDC055722]
MSMTSVKGLRTDRVPGRKAAAPEHERGDRRYGAAFWTVAGVFVTAMAFSTVPTPLYPPLPGS